MLEIRKPWFVSSFTKKWTFQVSVLAPIVRVVINPWKKARATRILTGAKQMADIPIYSIRRWSRTKFAKLNLSNCYQTWPNCLQLHPMPSPPRPPIAMRDCLNDCLRLGFGKTIVITIYRVSKSSWIFWHPSFLWHGWADQAHIPHAEQVMS